MSKFEFHPFLKSNLIFFYAKNLFRSTISQQEVIINPAVKVDSIFYELQCYCAEGCGQFEATAQNYRRRPCFKKIELLLSRLKQELNVHHNIVSNINSQGTAWVIKDLIFVFTRIVNAWIIMRGYIYDASTGLNPMRAEFDPDFIENFLEWQAATLKFMKPLVTTVDNLNVFTHNKDASKKKKEKCARPPPGHKEYDAEFLENFQKQLFTPQCLDNSEELQLRTHHTKAYFRAGIMKPLMMPQNGGNMSSSVTSPMSPASQSSCESDIMKSWFSNDDLQGSPIVKTPNSERLYNRGRLSLTPETPNSHSSHSKENPFTFDVKSRVKKGLVDQFNSMELKSSEKEEDAAERMKIDLNDILEMEEELTKMYRGDASKIIYLLREISKLPHVEDCAFWINMMISKIKVGKYGKIADILCEFKMLVQQAKSLMKNASESKKLLLKVFVSGLESVLGRKAFE